VERRLLQSVVALVALIPVLAGSAGAMRGLSFVGATGGVTGNSHFSYLSGLLLGIGLCYWSCVPAIERKGARLTLLTVIVFVGGLGRAFSLLSMGAPSRWHVAALGVELLVAPAVWLWQRRVAAGAPRTEPV
jgi:hypothetical protein